jgi:hypothetical protein
MGYLMEFKTKSGTLIATDYVRVEHGGRGKYIEFAPEHMIMDNLIIPENHKYRFTDYWKKIVYYLEYRSNDDSNVKIYHQLKEVDYAQYKIGMFYIAPRDLIFEGELKDESGK